MVPALGAVGHVREGVKTIARIVVVAIVGVAMVIAGIGAPEIVVTTAQAIAAAVVQVDAL